MKRMTIKDVMMETHSLAEHVDTKNHKTADIFSMVNDMLQSLNKRVISLEKRDGLTTKALTGMVAVMKEQEERIKLLKSGGM